MFISLLEGIVDRAADHLERVGTIAAATSKEVFQAADGKSRNFTSQLRRIGEEGDFTSDIRESLVSLSRLTAFYTAVFDLDRKTEGRKVSTLAFEDTAARSQLLDRSRPPSCPTRSASSSMRRSA